MSNVQLTNETDPTDIVDVDTGFALTDGVIHGLVHKGWLRDAGVHDADLDAGETQIIGVTVGAIASGLTARQTMRAGLHSRIDISVIGGVRLELLNVGSFTDGTAHTPKKFNDNNGVALKSSFLLNPTLNDTSDNLDPEPFGSTTAGVARGSASVAGLIEKILAPGGKYAVKITSLVDNTQVKLKWLVYERFLA